ncbi:MAG: valine--tRNA ligase [Candidatus Kariarchaeaceae archaeon]|jgi:valyl-tRNA synthetase
MAEMKPKLSEKKYNPKINEAEIFNLWQDEKIYEFIPSASSDKNPLFTIDTPPPYTNSSWHLGSTVHYLMIDMIARMQRMKGYNVHFPMGLDRNGLPIEIAAEKKFKVNMHKMEREEFLQLCQKILDQVGSQVLDLCYKIGMSCNSFEWDKVYKTDYPEYRALTQATFIEMWNKGLVYEDDRPNNWDYKLQTTIADAEIEYKEGSHDLHDIIFRIKETNEEFMFATTRLELIPAIRVIVYHPNDKRYQKLEGKTAVVPLWDIEVPIIAHHSADPEFGTGMMQVCSYGDTTDVRTLRELNISPVYAIDLYGRLTEATGKYKGLKIKEGKKVILTDLQKLGVIKSSKTVPHRFPTSERSGAPIEFIGMNEYYLKQESVLDDLKKYSDDLNFHPEFMRQVWKDWLDRISMDWPISRRRFYGTEVPVWYCNKCKHAQVPEPGPYYQPWKDHPPFESCEKCGENEFTGDVRTFDTWMDSSVSPLYISKYPNNKENHPLLEEALARDYIADIRPQGKDIVRTWLHYTMLRIHHLYNRKAFNHAWISGHVVLESGEKMSKSGKGMKPEPIVERYGGDAIRLFGAMEASHGSDIRFSETRLKGGAKFLNKVYNIARFISSFERPTTSSKYQPADNWILSELAKVTQIALEGYDTFDPHPAARAIRYFTQEQFASHYIELVKNRAYNRDDQFTHEETNAAIETLYQCLDAILKYLAPITPFITDYIYRQLYNKSIHLERFPSLIDFKDETSELTRVLQAYNSSIWNFKKESGISLREGLKSVSIPDILLPLANDLTKMHKINSIEGKSGNNSTEIELIEDIKIYIKL